jgi:hypothetical protein
MRFQLGETYESGFPGFLRRSTVIEIWDEGRAATMQFADGSEITVYWDDIHRTGRWRLVTVKP